MPGDKNQGQIMTPELDHLSLINLNNGAAVEIFQKCMEEVMDNIHDYSTDPQTPRTITLKIKFEPNNDRTGAEITVTPKVELAAVKACRGSIFITSKNGKPVPYVRDIRQEKLFNEEPVGGKQ